VTGQVVQVLFTDHVKQLKKIKGIWPIEFAESNTTSTTNSAANVESVHRAAAELEGLSMNAGAEGKDKEAAAAVPLGLENKVAEYEESYSSSDDDLPPIIKIQNRRVVDYQVSESESDEEDDREER
jgi:hypothetical protein